MCDYMYQYRGEIERIIINQSRDEAWNYTVRLYNDGLVSLPEWNTLSEYSKEYRLNYEKAGLK